MQKHEDDKFTLVNPSVKDFIDDDLQSADHYESEKFKPSKDQLKFDVDSRFTKLKQRANTLRTLIRRRNDYIEVSIYWKNPAFPFAIVSAIFTVLTFFFIGIFKFSEISPTIPIIYDPIENRWDSADKSIIFIFPIILAGIEVTVIANCFKIFQTEKRLALIMSWVMVFINMMLLVSLGQMSRLVL